MNNYNIDKEKIRDFFNLLNFNNNDLVCLRAISKQKGSIAKSLNPFEFKNFDTEIEKALDFLEKNKFHNLYLAVNSGHKDFDVKECKACFFESDSLSLDRQLKNIESLPLKPSFIVKTKKSYHAYFVLSERISKEEFIDLQKRLISNPSLQADSKLINPSRVMRMPALPYRGEGLDSEIIVSIENKTDQTYSLKELKEKFPNYFSIKENPTLKSQSALQANNNNNNLVEIERDFIDKIKQAIPDCKLDSIKFNSSFERFGIGKKSMRGAYTATAWNFNNQDYARISFTSHRGEGFETLYSYDKDKAFKSFSDTQKSQFKAITKELERVNALSIEIEKEEKAKKASENYENLNLVKSLPSYFEKKKFSLLDLERASLLSNLRQFSDKSFIAYPLKDLDTLAFSGLGKIYDREEDNKRLSGSGFYVFGLNQSENKNENENENIQLSQEELEKIEKERLEKEAKQKRIKDIEEELKVLERRKNRLSNLENLDKIKQEIKTREEELKGLKEIDKPKEAIQEAIETKEASQEKIVISNENVIYITEGLATGLTVFLATEKITIVCNGVQNIEKACKWALKSFPGSLIVIACDNDFKTKISQNNALRVIEKLGLRLTSKLPYSKKKLESEKLDFDDLRQLEGLESVSKILDSKEILKNYLNSIQEDTKHLEYIKYNQSLDRFDILSNFIIKKDFDFKKESTERHIRLLSKNEHSKAVSYDNDIFTTIEKFREFVYKIGNFTVEDKLKEIGLESLKKHLINKPSYFVSPLKKIGLNSENKAYYFENCSISKDGLKLPMMESGFFENGIDSQNNKLALSFDLESSCKLPSLNLDIDLKSSQDLLKELIELLKEAYSGFNPIYALSSLFSGLLRKQIAKGIGSNNMPALFLTGEPQAGKSNLIKILERIQGFSENSGSTAKDTEPVINSLLKARSALLTPIVEIKTKQEREKIESILQLAYDNALKGRKRKTAKGWETENATPDGFIVVDSNHYFEMESLLERIIQIEFLAKDFKVKEAIKINKLLDKLSGITRHFLEWVCSESNLKDSESIYLKIYNNYQDRGYTARECLVSCYLEGGLLLLTYFLSSEFKEFSESIRIAGIAGIPDLLKQAKENRLNTSLANDFLTYFYAHFLPKHQDIESSNIKSESLTKELYIASSLINSCIEDYYITQKGVNNHSKTDIHTALERAKFTKDTEKVKWLDNKSKRCYAFDIAHKDLPKAIKDKYDLGNLPS